jgi:ABC-type iron transport system FetAB permease component
MGSVAISAVIATSLGYRGFFTPAHQLKEPPPTRAEA